jgi:cyanamide hydratase
LTPYLQATIILKQQFPEHASLSPSTLALACLLHDIGTTEENMSSTRLSFEFQGGFQALTFLQEYGSTKDQAEAVCETIIRHQDLGTEGNITFLGQLIQLATIYDNVGEHPHVEDFGRIIDENTRGEVNEAFPREGWLGCFAETIRKEEALKPWCHTTHIPNFAEQVEGNQLQKPYE